MYVHYCSKVQGHIKKLRNFNVFERFSNGKVVLKHKCLSYSCELHMRSSCPQPLQPVPVPCATGPVEIKFFGMGQSFNITGLLPYANYELCVVSYNNMGSTVSDWVSITTLKERMALITYC